MEKMKFETDDLSQKNVEKIGKLFPNCITETKDANGKLKKAIDFEMLKQMLSDDVIDEGDESYEFTWVGKKEAMVEANKPIRKTLRPCKEESKDWDNTENLYIEGDNLEVLKLLQESYLNKVKMIYIDPPYNTGNDFIYNDDFKMDCDEYKDETGEVDDEGNRLFKNTDTNGRFHSDWCSMMYSRLMLARNLLSDDGVIFISIDDNEQENLKKICDEVFGEENAISPLIWSLPRGINAGVIARAHEYIWCYSKNRTEIKSFNRPEGVIYSIERCNKKIDKRHPSSIIHFPKGIRYEGKDQKLYGKIEGSESINILGEMEFKNGQLVKDVSVEAGWTMKNMILEWLKGNDVKDTKGQRIIEFFFKGNGKLYSKKEVNTYSIKSILKDMPDTQKARIEIKELFGNEDIFPYPKTYLLPQLFNKLVTNTEQEDIILDFFSGSATTAHAVMDLNAVDGGNRKFIMVQLPEECDEKSEAFKAGYKNICEIGKERIRRAGEKIKADNADKEGIENLDTGFRVLKVDDTNMKDVYYTPDKYSQRNLFDLESNIKEDRTELDLLYGCLIDWGLPLNRSYESKEIESSMVHIYNDGDLIACFDEDITEEAIKKIAKMEPLRAVFRDSSFKTSSEKINVEEIFKLLSPETSVRVL